MRLFISIFLLLLFAFLSAYMAKQRGRDPVAWFMIGILLGIFAPILLLILRPVQSDSKALEDIEEDENARLTPLQEESLIKSYTDKEWFYLDLSRQQQGPVYFKALKTLWLEKKITISTYVWSEGMAQWKKIEELPGFVEAL